MPPWLNLWGTCRALTVRSKPLIAVPSPAIPASVFRRRFADGTHSTRLQEQSSKEDVASNIESDIIPANAIRNVENANRTLGEAVGAASAGSSVANMEALRQLELLASGVDTLDPELGLKFDAPEGAPGAEMNMRSRYDPVVHQVTRLLMRDGKLSKAQSHMAMILNFLRTSPAPKVNPARPLLPGSPPPSHLPLNPVLYLTTAIDSVAPLIRIRAFSGLAGGGKSLEVPTPMAVRQRRRVAFMWILDVVNKKKSRGSGRAQFAHRVAEEIVAVIEGRSTVWDRRQIVHKLATTSRANLNHPGLRKRR